MRLAKIIGIISVMLLFFSFVFVTYGNSHKGVTISEFSLVPDVVSTTSGENTQFRMTLRGTINSVEFNSQCGSNHNSIAWYVYAGAGIKKAQGTYTISRTQNPLPFNVSQNISVKVSAPEFRGGTFDYYAQIYCSDGNNLFGQNPVLAESDKIKITFGTSSTTDKTWACIAADNKYACSPTNSSNLFDVPACVGRTPIQIGKNLCSQDAGTGPGPTQPSRSGEPGETQTFRFEIPNPLAGGADDLAGLVKILAQWIFNLAMVIAVVMIVYSGVLFLTAQGDTGKITKAKDVLKWAVVGLAIILIGSGFVTLIQSILNLGTP